MSLMPERWPGPVRQGIRTGLVFGAVGAAGTGLLWFGSDRILGRIYEQFRPRLEQQIGQAMGHPLRLGPYRGFGVDGLRIGPSRFLPGERDASTLKAQSTLVFLDPLASLRSRTLKLDLSFRGVEADLRRNAEGRFWVLGRQRKDAAPPPLDLRLRLAQPAAVRLWGLGRPSTPLELTAVGQVGLQLQQRSMDLRARVRLPGEEGAAELKGAGSWQKNLWKADLRLQRLSLSPFARFLPGSTAAAGAGGSSLLQGRAEGRLQLDLRRGEARCDGDLRLRGLQWRPQPSSPSLIVDQLPLRCRDRRLEVARSRWRFGDWNGSIAGRADSDGRLGLRLEARPPDGGPLGDLPLQASLRGRWQEGELRIANLTGRRGEALLRAQGRLGRRIDLQATWRLDPRELPGSGRWPDWLVESPLAGTLTAQGALANPRLEVRTGQEDLALVGPWQASLRWSDQMLRLESFRSPHLRAAARLPLGLKPGRGLVSGELQLNLKLRDYPLERLNPLLGTTLQGVVDASGEIRGPLQALQPDLSLTVANPGAGPLLLAETWRGSLVTESGGNHLLRMRALEPAPRGRLQARLDPRWQPVLLRLDRADGQLTLEGDPGGYRWTARDFPLRGLAVSTGPERPFEPLMAELSGSGTLGLQPLGFQGDVALEQPRFLGLAGRRIQAKVNYSERAFDVAGTIEPLPFGSIDASVRGSWQGPVEARFQARNLTNVLFRQMARALPRLRGGEAPPSGSAADLGTLVIDTLGGSIQDQLKALAAAMDRLAAREARREAETTAERLERLQASIDADLTLSGPSLSQLRAELTARGHFWLDQEDRAEVLASEPFEVTLEGPIRDGSGSFSLSGLPLSLLALLTPVPGSLQGELAARGRYRLGAGGPDLTATLSLVDTTLADRSLQLERGEVSLRGRTLAMDLALRAEGAGSNVVFAGSVPLDPGAEGLELRLATRGDGLRFLTALAGDTLEWVRGSADLQLLVRGSLSSPIANGFLRLRQGEVRFIGQTVRDLEATFLFDFEQILLQELTARVGRKGRLSGEGKLGLVRPLWEEQTLALELDQIPFSLERITAQGDGRITMGGSLTSLALGGEVAVSRGRINAQPGKLSPVEDGGTPDSDQPASPSSVPELLEAKWDFQEPLVLLGPDVESPTAETISQSIPNVPFVRFEDLRLSLGPDLRVELGNLASFTTGGSLRLRGRLDPSLRASGVVRLLRGHVSLFTTRFNLDPDAPNVAIFTPSLGLVPYLDIAMRTRVSDTLNVVEPSMAGSSYAISVKELEESGRYGSLNQLNLILVTVSVSGPADRIGENFTVRSNPPMPLERLVALIGGNSLAGLRGGSAVTALATVFGQSLLSPLLSTLTAAMGQRVSLALYPTYVNPQLDEGEETRSRKVPPQLVLGTEVGVDISDRVNASVLAAPNRSDIAPQLNLDYKATENLSLEGAIDTQGSWEGQLRVFLRF